MFERIGAIWELGRQQRGRYAAAIAALVVASCFLYLAPLIPQITIDGVLAPEPGAASGFTRWAVDRLGGRTFLAANLWLPAVLVIGLTGLAGVFTYLRGRWAAEATEHVIRSARERVYDHLQRLPCRYFDDAETGDLVQRCTSDVETVRTFLSTQIVEIGRALVMLAVPIPLMLAIDVRMTLVSLLMVPPIVAFSLVYFRRIRATFKEVDEAEGRLTATLQENLTGIRVVRAFARQEHECAKFAGRNEAHRERDYRLYELLARFWATSDLICFLQKAIVVAAGAYWLAVGELRVGAFYYFLTAVTMFIWPVRMMGRILSDLGKALVAIGRLREILDEPTEGAGASPGIVPARPLRGAIELEHVSFAHGAAPVLEDVSFRVEAGETVAIIGPSGCGKTTIVSLLLRLYDYDEGSIRLDGHELRDLDRTVVRAQAATVMQEPFLYSKTLRDNIRIARPEAMEEEVVEAAVVACVHESIASFDAGYDTTVGERGVTLSGGQRQRVALARALVLDPAVLILDDALSAVDNETETAILEALRDRHGRHTTLLIAHRLSTLARADRILVMERGRIVQVGTHDELRTADGLYRRLWEIQHGEVERDPAMRALLGSAPGEKT